MDWDPMGAVEPNTDLIDVGGSCRSKNKLLNFCRIKFKEISSLVTFPSLSDHTVLKYPLVY